MALENKLNQPRQGGLTVNFHDADGDERGIAHGTWAAIHGREREESYVRAWEKEGTPCLKLKVKLKISKL